MIKQALVSNFLLVALAAHAQVPGPTCNIPAKHAADPAHPPIVVVSSPVEDLGAKINMAYNQAVFYGSHEVIVKYGPGGPAPMVTPVQLNGVKDFAITLDPDLQAFSWNVKQPIFGISGAINFKLTGGHIFAGGEPTNAPACVTITGGDNNPIDGVELSNFECSATTSRAVNVQGFGTTVNSAQNISIHDTFIHDTGSHNIFASGVNNLCIQNNILVNPANKGVNGTGDPVNVSAIYAENVYFANNYVAGTPAFFRQPNPVNTPPSAFYTFSAQNVTALNNFFDIPYCTLATCSDYNYLPSSPAAIHNDTVINAVTNNNSVTGGFGIGVTCELSWNCTAAGNKISNVYVYGIYDEANVSENSVSPLTSTNGLQTLGSANLQTVADTIAGNPTPVVQATIRGAGAILSQTFPGVSTYGVTPFSEIWVKSANGQPADGLELWISADTNLFNAHSKMPLPALPAGQWVRVALAAPHITQLGIHGLQTWGLVNPGGSGSDVVSVSDYRQIADSRNNYYTQNTINSTGAFPLDVSGCGTNTTFFNNTITDPGKTGIWPYYNTGMIGQVFIGGYPNCTRTNVNFINNTVHMIQPNELGGSAFFNISNYGANNTITGVVLRGNTADGPNSAIQAPYFINSYGPNSNIAAPTVQ